MTRAIVFDLDGTLVDSAPDIASGINRMLAGHGLPAQDVELIERLTGEGAQSLVGKVYEALGVSVDTKRLEDDTRVYLAHYRERPVDRSVLFADAATALPALRRAGLRLAVCTNKIQSLAELVLDHFDLSVCIQAVAGSDTTPYRKPHPAPLLHTLKLLDVGPEDAIFVGDTTIDRDCAAAAGVACRIVGWGNGRDVEVPAATRLGRFSELLPASAGNG